MFQNLVSIYAICGCHGKHNRSMDGTTYFTIADKK